MNLIKFPNNEISQYSQQQQQKTAFHSLLALSILYNSGLVICSKSCVVRSSQCVEISPEQYSSKLAAPTSSATQ